MKLQTDRIYSLPDGKELVVRSGDWGCYLLHDPTRGVAAAPLYMVDESGELLSWERVHKWSLSDLHDTGRESEPVMKRLTLL